MAKTYLKGNNKKYQWIDSLGAWRSTCSSGAPITSPIVTVGTTTGIDYAPYGKCVKYDSEDEYTGPWHSSALSPADNSVMFDANESTRWFPFPPPKSPPTHVKFLFIPPEPIVIEKDIEIKGGVMKYAGNPLTAQLLVNDSLIVQKPAFDLGPEWLSGTYSGGLINKIEFRQKERPNNRDGQRFSVNAIKIDGEFLVSSASVTVLTFSDDKDLDTWKYNDHVVETDSSGNAVGGGGVGTVGQVYGNTVSFLKIEPGWSTTTYARNITQNPF